MGKYVDSHLIRDEKVILRAKRTGVSLIGTWIFGILFCWLLLIPLFKAIIETIKYFSCELALTNKRVVGKVGVASSKTLDLPLNKIQNVSTSSKLGGKIFGYGTVSISSASGNTTFSGVKKPETFKTAVMNQMEEFEQDRMKQQAAQMAQAMAGVLNK